MIGDSRQIPIYRPDTNPDSLGRLPGFFIEILVASLVLKSVYQGRHWALCIFMIISIIEKLWSPPPPWKNRRFGTG